MSIFTNFCLIHCEIRTFKSKRTRLTFTLAEKWILLTNITWLNRCLISWSNHVCFYTFFAKSTWWTFPWKYMLLSFFKIIVFVNNCNAWKTRQIILYLSQSLDFNIIAAISHSSNSIILSFTIVLFRNYFCIAQTVGAWNTYFFGLLQTGFITNLASITRYRRLISITRTLLANRALETHYLHFVIGEIPRRAFDWKTVTTWAFRALGTLYRFTLFII